MELNNFIPQPTLSKALLPTATSQRIALSDDGYSGGAVYIYNASTLDCAVNFGDVTVTALLPVAAGAAGDMVIPSGGTVIVNVPASTAAFYASAIASGTATGNIYFSPGQGS